MIEPFCCSGCGNDFDEIMPIDDGPDGHTRWLCTACHVHGKHVLGQPSPIEMKCSPIAAEWPRDVEVVVALFSTDTTFREHRPDARLEFRAQWHKVEPLLEQAGIRTFHPLFQFIGGDDGNDASVPGELEYVLAQCRRHGVALVVADEALLPYGTRLDGVLLVTPWREGAR